MRLHDAVPPLRLGIVPYLNVQPMVYGLREACPQLTLIFAPPSELERMLEHDEIDVGIVPVVAAFSPAGRAIFGAPVIASQGEVYSVLIVASQPLERLRWVCRDAASLTSNALARILLHEHWRLDIPLAEPSTELAPDEGRVIIGDPAILQHDRWPFVYDLGQAWRDYTDLPFVFAAWIGRAGQDLGPLPSVLFDLVERNMDRLDEVVQAHPALGDLPLEQRTRYLRENLSFRFGPDEKAAVTRFHQSCIRHGIAGGHPLTWAD